MRGRTALAGSTLALLTLVWSAPGAWAADNDKDPGTSTTAPAPGGSGDNNGGRGSEPTTHPTTKPAEPTTKPTATTKPQPVKTPTPSPQIAIPDPKPTLSVAPRTVAPGGAVTANPRCENGRQESLTGDGVAFSGNIGHVAPNASLGNHTVTLVCANGPKRFAATATFSVQQGPGNGPVQAHLAVSPKSVKTGDVITANVNCEGGRPESLSADGVAFNGNTGRVSQDASEGPHTAVLVCTNGRDKASATDNFMVNRHSGPGDGDVHATLSISPGVVRQGDYLWANGGCVNGQQQSLSGDDVWFRGDRGTVRDNARLGDHSVTRVCVNGAKRDVATRNFRVVPGDGPGNGEGPRDFWLSDRSGYRGDSVDLSVRCRDNSARVESDGLDDLTLHRDGSRLTGTTHVANHAGDGWHKVTVSCDGHTATEGFRVLRDRDHDKYLDLDPGYGHPGDAIDVHVGCDSSVGSLDSEDNVLDDIDLDHDGRPWRYEGTTHVRDDAEPGEHSVKVRCGDDTLEESFFVQGADDHSGDGDDTGGGDTVSVYPKGAPETGGGPVGSSAGVLALGISGLLGASGQGIGATRRENRR